MHSLRTVRFSTHKNVYSLKFYVKIYAKLFFLIGMPRQATIPRDRLRCLADKF